MKKLRHTESQIVKILQAASGRMIRSSSFGH